ncbi:MAG: protein kinase [Candidatus Promineifilaceae bacterium]|nr:protein kinase [Candidatus Promineifilaceae bacterium]
MNERYRLLERIGSGGMAAVYKAQDLMLRRQVAVKMLHESLTGDDLFLRRFQREAHAAANLAHPNIVTVHDIGQEELPHGYRHYIVMEYVEGRTLKKLIRSGLEESGAPLTVARALDLAIQIAGGIGYAHRAGLVHCDVKPQNMLVTADDRVKVADFGIARAMSEASRNSASLLWGTPHYFAPEQAAGEPAAPASDVYAIGIILFEMLTGRLPFEADTLPALALKHLQEPPPLVTEFNPAVPVQLEQIVNKLLSKEPAGRYRTAGQLERILRTYRESSLDDTGPLMPVVPPRPARRDKESDRDRHRQRQPQPEQAPTEQEQDGPAARKTEIYRRPAPPIITARATEMHRRERASASRRAEATQTAASEAEQHLHVPVPRDAQAEQQTQMDRRAVALAVAAIILMLGLIPLWYAVARAWHVW